MQTFNIPVGISDFSEIRQNGYYYVDKTGLIAELLNNSAAKVTLITRPRRLPGSGTKSKSLSSIFIKTVTLYLKDLKFPKILRPARNG